MSVTSCGGSCANCTAPKVLILRVEARLLGASRYPEGSEDLGEGAGLPLGCPSLGKCPVRGVPGFTAEGMVRNLRGEWNTIVETCCQPRLSHRVSIKSPLRWRWKLGKGDREPPKSAQAGDGMGRTCLHNLSFQLVPPILGHKGQGFPWCSNLGDHSKGSLGLSEAGVLVAVGFLLCPELSPGER